MQSPVGPPTAVTGAADWTPDSAGDIRHRPSGKLEWKAQFDTDRQKVYYANRRTQTYQWNRPSGVHSIESEADLMSVQNCVEDLAPQSMRFVEALRMNPHWNRDEEEVFLQSARRFPVGVALRYAVGVDFPDRLPTGGRELSMTLPSLRSLLPETLKDTVFNRVILTLSNHTTKVAVPTGKELPQVANCLLEILRQLNTNHIAAAQSGNLNPSVVGIVDPLTLELHVTTLAISMNHLLAYSPIAISSNVSTDSPCSQFTSLLTELLKVAPSPQRKGKGATDGHHGGPPANSSSAPEPSFKPVCFQNLVLRTEAEDPRQLTAEDFLGILKVVVAHHAAAARVGGAQGWYTVHRLEYRGSLLGGSEASLSSTLMEIFALGQSCPTLTLVLADSARPPRDHTASTFLRGVDAKVDLSALLPVVATKPESAMPQTITSTSTRSTTSSISGGVVVLTFGLGKFVGVRRSLLIQSSLLARGMLESEEEEEGDATTVFPLDMDAGVSPLAVQLMALYISTPPSDDGMKEGTEGEEGDAPCGDGPPSHEVDGAVGYTSLHDVIFAVTVRWAASRTCSSHEGDEPFIRLLLELLELAKFLNIPSLKRFVRTALLECVRRRPIPSEESRFSTTRCVQPILTPTKYITTTAAAAAAEEEDLFEEPPLP